MSNSTGDIANGANPVQIAFVAGISFLKSQTEKKKERKKEKPTANLDLQSFE